MIRTHTKGPSKNNLDIFLGLLNLSVVTRRRRSSATASPLALAKFQIHGGKFCPGYFWTGPKSIYFFIFLMIGSTAWANNLHCEKKEAQDFLVKAFALQKDNNTPKAVNAYQECLKIEPDCVDCLYEIGWSYWKLGEWKKVIESWKKALKLKPDHEKIQQFLPAAENNLVMIKADIGDRIFRTKVELLKESQPAEGPLQILMVARWQSYNPKPDSVLDHYDLDIDSPKSVNFSKDGSKVYVNSLEGSKTVVLKSNGLEKLSVIKHKFNAENESLVDAQAPFDYKFKNKKPRLFQGKPVEAVTTHNGKYLWATYYRRNFDEMGLEPSAMAIIDTKTDAIVRVMGTGSISKYIAVSPNGKWLVVSNWGDNTVGLYDIHSAKPEEFKEAHLLVVGERLSLKNLKSDRDKDCGFCVRGLEFSEDGNYLLVTRMKGGGIAVFDLREIDQGKKPIYRGTVFGIQPGPRDIHLSPDGKSLFMGCNSSGSIAKIKTQVLIDLVKDKNGEDVKIPTKEKPYQRKFIGLGVRSFKISPDGKYLFVAVNNTSEVVVVNAEDLSVLARLPVDSYPVGLSVSSDGTQLWVTSQGKDHKGGNSVGVFQVLDRIKNNVHKIEK